MDYKKIVYKRFENNPKRLNHTLGVLNRSIELANIYNANKEVLEAAALLHDITKLEPLDYHIKKINDEKIINKYPKEMLHAFSAKEYAKELKITDKRILEAINHHIFGKIDMSLETMILVVSDFCEENRTHKNALKVYQLSLTNLKEAYLLAMESTFNYLKEKGLKPLDIQMKTYLYYKRGEDK